MGVWVHGHGVNSTGSQPARKLLTRRDDPRGVNTISLLLSVSSICGESNFSKTHLYQFKRTRGPVSSHSSQLPFNSLQGFLPRGGNPSWETGMGQAGKDLCVMLKG